MQKFNISSIPRPSIIAIISERMGGKTTLMQYIVKKRNHKHPLLPNTLSYNTNNCLTKLREEFSHIVFDETILTRRNDCVFDCIIYDKPDHGLDVIIAINYKDWYSLPVSYRGYIDYILINIIPSFGLYGISRETIAAEVRKLGSYEFLVIKHQYHQKSSILGKIDASEVAELTLDDGQVSHTPDGAELGQVSHTFNSAELS